MKGEVYKDNPHTSLELKVSIANFIRNISPIEMELVFANKVRHRCVSTSK
jgi:hypothetical protein